tara:strand:+ start:1285 stop:1809 length:525 start_codon:yes stop_codon:yes gene_type:complete
MNNNLIIQHSISNYDSTNEPFFSRNIDNNIIDTNSINIIDNNIDLLNQLKDIDLDNNIKEFLIKNNGITKELYINDYTFFSIQKIIELYNNRKKDNIVNIIDICFIYEGMGWINVGYYNSNFKKIYFRLDGGANMYDRMENYNNLKKIAKINDENLLNIDGINFDQLLSKINAS